MPYPRFVRVHQRFDALRVADVRAAVQAEFDRIRAGERIRPGQSVAIATGSRGIDNVALIVRTVAEAVRRLGARPFLVPAMGSHGGGTADGQRRVLESYGVTEEYVGAPIRSSMEVVQVATTPDGLPVWWDRHAREAGCVVLVNRVKPHPVLCGPIESGLVKMAMIGLGKQIGASLIHRAAAHRSWPEVVAAVGGAILERCPIAFGIAIVENAYDQTGHIEAVPPGELLDREPELLAMARRWMPRIPLDAVDLLVVDEMGKNLSGLGMDTTVTGRKPDAGAAGAPRIARVFVRDLTPDSHGNAHGIGLADFTTARLVRAMDYRATVLNAMTALHPEAAALPVHFDTDREALDAALASLGLVPPEQARVVRIRNTLHLDRLDASEPCLPALTGRAGVEIAGPARDLAFDEAGNLAPFAAAG